VQCIPNQLTKLNSFWFSKKIFKKYLLTKKQLTILGEQIYSYKSFYIRIHIHLLDGEMRKDSLDTEDGDADKLSSHGKSIYYFGSAVFIIGIGLIILGSALVMVYQIGYESEKIRILYTILSIAVGIIMILVGINLMIKQSKRGYAIIFTSVVFSILASYLFFTNYLHSFYYPLVSYIFGFYIIAFLGLLGNAFASVIVWIIGNKPVYQTIAKEKQHLYTDEEILRDIEEATQKSIESAVNELQFDLEDLPKDIIVGKTVPKSPGTVIRVKDDIGEVISLSHTLGPMAKDKFGSVGIDKASNLLAETMSQDKKKKDSLFKHKIKLFEKKEAKQFKKEKKINEIKRKNQEKIEAKRKQHETRKKEKELKKKKIEEEHKKRIEMKKAQKEAIIRERKAKEEAIRLEKLRKKEQRILKKNKK
jgi:hypothetical protein